MKINNYKYLKDISFLEKIYSSKIAEHYAKVIVLNWKEEPIQEIQGRVVTGSLNIDGSSAMRRTCNITFYAESLKDSNIFNIENSVSINKKIYLEIGLTNTTLEYPDYPIIWIPCGLFIILDNQISNSEEGISISLQLKDKMCLLNGECGGTISASTQFDEHDEILYNEDGTTKTVLKKLTIYQIIQELVNHFGNEQLGKIIINDLSTRIKKVMKWGGTNPIYFIQNENQNIEKYQVIEPVLENAGTRYPAETLTQTQDENNQTIYHYWINEETPVVVDVFKYEYGQDIGYIYSDFYFPSELTAAPGDNVCSILDKIKNILGNYEYYYDLEGNFIFQEIKNYLNTSFSTVELNNMKKEDYQVNQKGRKNVYDFNNSKLLISITNSPQYNNIKNDFYVWGTRKDVSGLEIPIRYHLAIDKKPEIGNVYKNVFLYTDPEDNSKKAAIAEYYPSLEDIKEPILGSFYRIYSEDKSVKVYQYIGSKNNNGFLEVWDSKTMGAPELFSIKTQDWRTELFLQGLVAKNKGLSTTFYFTELSNEWLQLYDIKNGKFFDSVLNNPSGINYYLDFIDDSSEIGEYSVENIGTRTKVINDDSVNCLFEAAVPDRILIESGQGKETEQKIQECIEKGQKYYLINSSIFNLLSIGGTQNSAFNSIKNLLFDYTKYNQSISITCLPLYFLEVNNRISIKEEISNTYGDFLINSISISLEADGTMTINASEINDKL